MKLRHLKKSASCFHNCIVFTNIACQVQDRDLDEFFRHENSSFPPAPKKSQVTTWNRVRPTSVYRGNISFTRYLCNSWLRYLRWSNDCKYAETKWSVDVPRVRRFCIYSFCWAITFGFLSHSHCLGCLYSKFIEIICLIKERFCK